MLSHIQSKLNSVLPYFYYLLLVISLFLPNCKSFDDHFAEANRLYESWELEKCLESCELLIKREPNNLNVRMLYGNVLLNSGDAKNAKRLFYSLLNTYPDTITVRFNLALSYYYLGDLDSSTILLSQIISNSTEKEKPLVFSKCLNLLGLIAFNKADYQLAMQCQKESLRLALQVGSLEREADALRQIGVLNWYYGNIDSVISKYYEPAFRLYKATGNRKGEATVLSNIGLIYGTLENWVQKTKYQLEAMSIRKKIYDRIGIADSYYFLTHSIPYSEKGRTFVFSYYKKSYDLSSEIGYAWGMEIAARGLIDIQHEAINDFGYTNFQIDSSIISSTEGAIYKILTEANKSFKEGDFKSAKTLYKNGLFICDSLGIISGIEAPLIAYSDVLLELQEYDEAESAIEKAIKITTSIPRPHGYSESLYRLAKLYYLIGNKNESAILFEKLAHFYDSTFVDLLCNSDPSFAFEIAAGNVHLMRSQVYGSYISNLLALKKNEAAYLAVEKERALPFWGERDAPQSVFNFAKGNPIEEMINLIENHGKDDFNSTSNIETKIEEIYRTILTKKEVYNNATINFNKRKLFGVNDVISVMNPKEVVISYFTNNEFVYYFVITIEGMHVGKLNTNIADINSVIDIFNSTILKGKNSPQNLLWKKPSEKLYSILLKPLEDLGIINPSDHIFISPHRQIHFVPFQILLKEHNKFFIEDNIISYVPSVSYFVASRNKKNRAIQSMVAFAPDLQSLPFVKEEISELQKLNNLAVVRFENNNATAIKFLEDAGKYDLIHVAAHGKTNKKHPLYSFIQFADRNIELHELLKLNLEADLVLLSSCETGMSISEAGIFPSGHDIVSFPRAFITAGAASVISPLWLVEDKSTSEIVINFYRNLSRIIETNESNKFAKALTAAQREFLHNAYLTGEYNHPFYWGGFYVLGSD